MREDEVCPLCGSERTAGIVWGMVDPDAVEHDDVVFGGCVIDGPVPDRQCRGCGHRWHTRPGPLQWPDPRDHADGEWVVVRGTVDRVVLEATDPGDVWADFELLVEDRWPRLRCLAFPESFASLEVALEPGLVVSLRGRITFGRSNSPELHIEEWEVSGG